MCLLSPEPAARPRAASAPAAGGRVFGLQALFEAAEQHAVAFVLLVLPGVELPLDLEAPVHHEGRAQHREPVAGHVELAGLRGGKRCNTSTRDGQNKVTPPFPNGLHSVQNCDFLSKRFLQAQ